MIVEIKAAEDLVRNQFCRVNENGEAQSASAFSQMGRTLADAKAGEIVPVTVRSEVMAYVEKDE